MRNKVYLIGAGPGSPDLITLRGLNILKQADVVIYDYLVDKRILEEAKPDAELICCDAEVSASRSYASKSNFIRDKLGKNIQLRSETSRIAGRSFVGLSAEALAKADRYSDGFLIHNEKINQLVIKRVKQGKKVIRVKNGDPGIFSRTSQELEPLVKNKIEFEIIPGVPAANAASSLSGIPLTDRRFASVCVFVTGHEEPTKEKSSLDWESISKVGTIVLYMAVENLGKIVKQLLQAGKSQDTPVAIIQDASLLTQKLVIGTLANIVKKAKEQNIRPPAIIIIGEVVQLEKKFNWLKRTKRVIFTGISPQRFFTEGTVFHLPLIKIEPLGDYHKFDTLIRDIDKYDWLVFSSRYGVKYLFQRLNKIGYDARRLSRIKIAAIGNSTQNRLLDFGLLADLLPKEESSKGLLEAFKNIDIRNKRIFLPRSDLSDKGLSLGLESQGARVTSGIAYKNVMPKDLPDLDFHFFDEVMFSSPSGVRNFIKRYKVLPKKVRVRCIGEVTRNEAKRWHLLD